VGISRTPHSRDRATLSRAPATDARHTRIELEIDIRDHRIGGHATVDASGRVSFTGWLELVNVLEAAVRGDLTIEPGAGPRP
jgi:hypothetical protein